MKRVTIFAFSVALVSAASAQYVLTPVASGLTLPNSVAQPPGETNRFFVIEQRGVPNNNTGRIRVVNNGTLLGTPFLTLSNQQAAGGERGLLGMAFHPNYATNRTFFINYTRISDGATVIERVLASTANPNVADATSRDVILVVPQPFNNHNGGSLRFGADGYLYIGLGDGGDGNDPGDRAQDLNDVLGKMLRLDVNRDDFPADPNRDYGIPADNPYAVSGGAPEIWASGLRNPWQYNFDRRERNGFGALTIADVGQGRWEEMNYALPHQAGLNYGWRVREGAHNTGLGGVGVGRTFHEPFAEYFHSQTECSISGGEIIRDARLGVDAWGQYAYTDYCGTFLRSTPVQLDPETGALVGTAGTGIEFMPVAGQGGVGVTMLNDRRLYFINIALGRVSRLDATTASRIVSGTLIFQDVLASAAPRGVSFGYRTLGGSLIKEIQVGIPASGQFEVPAPTQNMQLHVKHGTWLRRIVNINTTGGNVTGVAISLINGDVDGDNEVGAADLSVLSSAFLTVVGDPGFVATADLDRDGEVGASDLSILSTNFLLSGD